MCRITAIPIRCCCYCLLQPKTAKLVIVRPHYINLTTTAMAKVEKKNGVMIEKQATNDDMKYQQTYSIVFVIAIAVVLVLRGVLLSPDFQWDTM